MRVRTSMSGKAFTVELTKAEALRLVKNIATKFGIKVRGGHDAATKLEQVLLEVMEYDVSTLPDV